MRNWLVILAMLLVAGCMPQATTEPKNSKSEGQTDKVDKYNPDKDKPDGKETAADQVGRRRHPVQTSNDKTAVQDKDKTIDKDEGKKPAPIPEEKWNFTLAEKTWGIKLKSMEYHDKTTKLGDKEYHDKQYKFLLEFGRDLTAEELKVLKQVPAFSGVDEVVYLDADNVVRQRTSQFSTQGELTGMKGDAFWVMLQPPIEYENTPAREKIVRAELRPRKN